MEKRSYSSNVIVETKRVLPSGKPGPSGFSRSDFSRLEAGARPENQHQFLTGLVGKEVKLSFVSGEKMSGVLRWFDQFTLAIEIESVEKMIFKSSVASIEGA